MKPIAGGKTKVTHPNVKATNTDKLPGIAGPKDMSHGMDLSGNATNSKGKIADVGMAEAESPTSRKNSFNQYRGGR